MRTILASLIVTLAVGGAAAGPDFTSPNPHGKALAASSGSNELMPQDDVIFAFDSADLTESAYAQLATAARWLKVHPRLRVVVEGYADHSGYAVYNEDLATRRAQAVRSVLMRHGIASDRVVMVTYGELFADPAGNPLDRRAVVYASALPLRTLVTASLDGKQALTAMWTERNAAFTETRGSKAVARR